MGKGPGGNVFSLRERGGGGREHNSFREGKEVTQFPSKGGQEGTKQVGVKFSNGGGGGRSQCRLHR